MKADTLFTGARVYNVFLKTWSLTDVAVLKDKILYVGRAEEAGLTAHSVIDCGGRPLIPGLIDIHLHIESSLCTPGEFARAVIKRGVTTIVSEPHEIANVFGIEGIRAMVEASADAPMDIFYAVPSSVPSTSSLLETTGGEISSEDLKAIVDGNRRMVCLGEVMNYSEIIQDFESLLENPSRSKSLDLVCQMGETSPLSAIEGHVPSVTGLDLAKVLYCGIDSDHCLQDRDSLKARFSQGMFVELQEKSVTEENIAYLAEHDCSGLYSFVTDDVPPDILRDKGHLDHVIRKAMKLGLPLEEIIVASSYSPARRIGFRDRGVIAPGRKADLLILSGTGDDFTIEEIYKNGVRADRHDSQTEAAPFPASFRRSIILPDYRKIEEALSVRTDVKGEVSCRVMRKNRGNTYTEDIIRALPAGDGEIRWEKTDVNLVLVISRYGKNDNIARGFADGCIFSRGALCSSYAHDHHNLLAMGDNREDMLTAIKRIEELQGGICIASEGKIIAEVALPIGGILSDLPLDRLAEEIQSVQGAMRKLGIDHPNPIMSICTITLPVSPALKITDRGLIDVKTTRIVDLLP